MGFALRKQDTGGVRSVPLRKRLHAWWNGYTLRPREIVADDGDGMADGAAWPYGDRPWTETRCQLARGLWSPGFIVPGGHAYVEKLVSGCNLTAAETMLELGVGMGGDTRTIIGKFGNYVTGYERDADLAAVARQHVQAYDMDDKVEVINEPLETVELKPGYFRAALLRDVLYTVDDKAGLLERASDALKPGESFLIATDFLFDAADGSPELEAWKAAEGREVFPATLDELTAWLQLAEITPRIVEDGSDDYCRMVIDAWVDFLNAIEGAAIPREMGQEMAREAEFWARRVAALETGALKYVRIEGVKVS